MRIPQHHFHPGGIKTATVDNGLKEPYSQGKRGLWTGGRGGGGSAVTDGDGKRGMFAWQKRPVCVAQESSWAHTSLDSDGVVVASLDHAYSQV